MGGVHSSNNSRGLSTAAYDPEEFWLQENLGKKGRVYGFGTEGVKLKKSATITAACH